jgi:hypothetical protein
MDQNYKKAPKYTYDYPENRELGKDLTDEDRKWIADKVKKTPFYIYRIFVVGDRNNKKAVDLAHIIVKQKRERDLLAKAV